MSADTNTATPPPTAAAKATTSSEAPAPRRSGNPGRRWLVGGLVVLVCLAFLSPVLWTAATVTKPTDVAFLNPPQFFYAPSFTSFVDLWQTTLFYQYVLNTLVVAVISTIVALAIGIPAAYALSRFPGWISAALLILALVFRALPRFSVVLPMYDISRALGIYDTTFAVAAALVAINQPFSIWLLRNFFAEIPKELDEAAMLDGSSSCSPSRST
jgi:multiple sugar transport system permease protein